MAQQKCERPPGGHGAAAAGNLDKPEQPENTASPTRPQQLARVTGDTANLQKLTVKQTAKLMNVSERSIYKAAAVMRLRLDLVAELHAGTLSLDRAYRIATGKPAAARVSRSHCPHCGGEL